MPAHLICARNRIASRTPPVGRAVLTRNHLPARLSPFYEWCVIRPEQARDVQVNDTDYTPARCYGAATFALPRRTSTLELPFGPRRA